MIKATFFTGFHAFYKNRFFSKRIKYIANHNANYILLKDRLKEHGIDLSSEDINPLAESAFALFHSPVAVTKTKNQIFYLLLHEPPIVNPKDWVKERHRNFDRVFTWDESLVDNKKYFLLRFGYNYSFQLTDKQLQSSFQKKQKLCALMAGNKTSLEPKEIYSERYKAIQWFTKNHPEQFDLYGAGWPTNLPPYILLHYLKYIPSFLRTYFLKLFPHNSTYQGYGRLKKNTLAKYKFSICYENMQDTPGYVTEKIFGSMAAGCIPVYLGASNIEKLIPKNCFIDKRDFSTYEDLYQFMENMNEKTYQQYLKNMKHYFSSSQAKIFNYQTYVKVLMPYILKDLKIR